MPDRPVVAPKFGRFLTDCRIARNLETGPVERIVSERYGVPLGHTSLWRYENGQTMYPDPAVIWALARLYGVSLEAMVLELVKDRATKPSSEHTVKLVKDRAVGISDEALALARDFEGLADPHHREVVLQAVQQLLDSESDRAEERSNNRQKKDGRNLKNIKSDK